MRVREGEGGDRVLLDSPLLLLPLQQKFTKE